MSRRPVAHRGAPHTLGVLGSLGVSVVVIAWASFGAAVLAILLWALFELTR